MAAGLMKDCAPTAPRHEATMKSPKRIAALLLAGFLAFAPPGTMIFLLALVVGFAGRRWAAVFVAFGLACIAALLLVRRRRARGNQRERPDTN
jgi:membrane protein implicated in regulation of membrane protease activity